jgi:hypothetical protein
MDAAAFLHYFFHVELQWVHLQRFICECSMQTRRSEPAGAALTPCFSYRWEIGAVLCLKAAGLALLYFLFFAPADRPSVTEQVVARHLLTMPGSGAGDEVNHHDR